MAQNIVYLDKDSIIPRTSTWNVYSAAAWRSVIISVLMCAQLLSCLTLCDPMNSSLPGSSFYEIFQARILEQVAVSYSRGSSRPRDGTCIFVVTWEVQFGWSVQFSCWAVSNSLRLHGLQHSRPPCPSSAPGVYSNPCPLSRWYHPTISSSVIPFSSCPQSFPASGSFPKSQLFTWGGQSIGVSASASVLPMNIQNWFP